MLKTLKLSYGLRKLLVSHIAWKVEWLSRGRRPVDGKDGGKKKNCHFQICCTVKSALGPIWCEMGGKTALKRSHLALNKRYNLSAGKEGLWGRGKQVFFNLRGSCTVMPLTITPPRHPPSLTPPIIAMWHLDGLSTMKCQHRPPMSSKKQTVFGVRVCFFNFFLSFFRVHEQSLLFAACPATSLQYGPHQNLCLSKDGWKTNIQMGVKPRHMNE